mmetsp:Transcript_5304/g.10231  ORF Transcript_5304/g.10231 Transcript_5304/m.10231 type:complete len:88 (-) Transcript_5304:480-743(-)
MVGTLPLWYCIRQMSLVGVVKKKNIIRTVRREEREARLQIHVTKREAEEGSRRPRIKNTTTTTTTTTTQAKKNPTISYHPTTIPVVP